MYVYSVSNLSTRSPQASGTVHGCVAVRRARNVTLSATAYVALLRECQAMESPESLADLYVGIVGETLGHS